MQDRTEKLLSYFNELDLEKLETLSDIYDPQVFFQDPMTSVHGLVPLKEHLAALYKRVSHIHFDFSEVISEQQSCAFFWTMQLRTPLLNRGQNIKIQGCSLLKFNPTSGKVIFHRDYFDMDELIYRHIPVLGGLIRAVKRYLI